MDMFLILGTFEFPLRLYRRFRLPSETMKHFYTDKYVYEVDSIIGDVVDGVIS